MKTSLIALLLVLTGCSGAAGGGNKGAWDKYVSGYLDAYFAVHPDIGVNAGRHEFDGKLPDFSKEAINREIARLHSERLRASAYGNGLDARQLFERDYLVASIDADLFWLESAQWPYRNPYFYSSPVDPSVYLTRPYAPLDRRMRAFINYETALPVTLRQVQANLRTPMPRTYVDLGRLTFGGLARYFEHDVPGIFKPVQDPQLQKDFSDANREAVRVLKSLDSWFESQRAAANDDFALGEAHFQQMLNDTERVDMPLAQLKAIGQHDLDRNLAALDKACAQFAPDKSLQECVAKEEADKPKGKPVEAAREQLKELRTFVADHNLVSIPGTEQALVDEAPPYTRWNFAYINIPGPYETGLPSVYYISPPDPKWIPISRRFTSIWSICVLPTRSPIPMAVACTHSAPATSAAMELAMASPRSQCPCQSTRTFSPDGLTTSSTTKRTSAKAPIGVACPAVSQITMERAP